MAALCRGGTKWTGLFSRPRTHVRGQGVAQGAGRGRKFVTRERSHSLQTQLAQLLADRAICTASGASRGFATAASREFPQNTHRIRDLSARQRPRGRSNRALSNMRPHHPPLPFLPLHSTRHHATCKSLSRRRGETYIPVWQGGRHSKWNEPMTYQPLQLRNDLLRAANGGQLLTALSALSPGRQTSSRVKRFLSGAITNSPSLLTQVTATKLFTPTIILIHYSNHYQRWFLFLLGNLQF